MRFSRLVKDMDSFLSFEKLDCSSPEPCVNWDLVTLTKTPTKNNNNDSNSSNTQNQSNKWMADLNKNDIDMLNDLATLNPHQLTERVKDLFEHGYQLGVEEANQMTRGKLLNILDSKISL